MNIPGILLYLAALLVVLVGAAHSWLGERHILMRLFRRAELPALTLRTLRFAWHITSLAWLGLAGVLVALAHPPATVHNMGAIVAVTFLIHFFIALIGSRGKHLSWIVFLAIAALAFFAARG